MSLKQHTTFEKIAEREKGVVDKVAGQPVVLSSRDAYFVRLGSGILGMQRPANRQELSRWLKFMSGNRKSQLPAPLNDAVAKLPADRQFLLAFDLQDVIAPETVRARLTTAKDLGDKVDVDAVARLLGGLKGLSVSVKVGDAIDGELTLHFAEDAGPLRDLARPLVTRALAYRGASLLDVLEWKTEVAGDTVRLSGPLSGEGFRKLLSFVQPPPPPEVAEGPADPKLAGELKQIATRQYLKSVGTILDDLQKAAKRAKRDTDNALWYEKSADKIEALSGVNVDQEALGYGRYAAACLHAIGDSLQGQNVKLSELEKYLNFYAYGSGWAFRNAAAYGAIEHWSRITTEQAKVAAEGAGTRDKIWRGLMDQTAQMRSKMKSKYGADF
jgi:hypothetical protein